jgi:hypothetical protein
MTSAPQSEANAIAGNGDDTKANSFHRYAPNKLPSLGLAQQACQALKSSNKQGDASRMNSFRNVI